MRALAVDDRVVHEFGCDCYGVVDEVGGKAPTGQDVGDDASGGAGTTRDGDQRAVVLRLMVSRIFHQRESPVISGAVLGRDLPGEAEVPLVFVPLTDVTHRD